MDNLNTLLSKNLFYCISVTNKSPITLKSTESIWIDLKATPKSGYKIIAAISFYSGYNGVAICQVTADGMRVVNTRTTQVTIPANTMRVVYSAINIKLVNDTDDNQNV